MANADASALVRSPLLSIFFLLFFSLCLLLPPVVGTGNESLAVRLLRSEPDLCPGKAGVGGCPINCFRADPVCGANGITYWCGCPDARCAGTRVVNLGPCAVSQSGVGAAVSARGFFWRLLCLGISVLYGLL